MPDDFTPPISNAPLRTRTFLRRMGEQSRRAAGSQISTGAGETRTTFQRMKIMSSSRDGSNFRWTYTVRSVILASETPFAAPTEVSANLTAYNTLERMNGASGLMGNGVDTANLAGTGLELQPAPAGAIVRADWDGFAWFFEYANGVDGTC
jgi:hypothetical protein